jgi:hypothetical protein
MRRLSRTSVFAGFKICWLVVPEGNGKTTFVGGLADYTIEFRESAYVPVAASAQGSGGVAVCAGGGVHAAV